MIDRESLQARLRELGCGDNSCWIAAPKGMATNGGCRCFPRGVPIDNEIRLKFQEAFYIYRSLVSDLEKAQ